MKENNLPLKTKPIYKTRAIVVNTKDDPLQVLRVQIRVPGWWDTVPDDSLPWAEYQLSSARAGSGNFSPAEEGDLVWVEFPDGDTRYPIIVGWCHYAPSGIPNLPPDAFNGEGKINHKIDSIINEPEPQEQGYSNSQVLERFGIVIEVTEHEELLITQRKTGTALRITKDGDYTEHIEGNSYESVAKDVFKHIIGETKEIRDGNYSNQAPKMDFGILGNLEPSVLGDKLAAAFAKLKIELDMHGHIGNLGAPTSAATQVKPFELEELLAGGNVYSKLNRNQ